MLTLVPSDRDPQPRVARMTLVPGARGLRQSPLTPAPMAPTGPDPPRTEAPPHDADRRPRRRAGRGPTRRRVPGPAAPAGHRHRGPHLPSGPQRGARHGAARAGRAAGPGAPPVRRLKADPVLPTARRLAAGPAGGRETGCSSRDDDGVGSVDVTGVRHTLPDGRVLLDGVSFRVGDGDRAALVGE